MTRERRKKGNQSQHSTYQVDPNSSLDEEEIQQEEEEEQNDFDSGMETTRTYDLLDSVIGTLTHLLNDQDGEKHLPMDI